MSLSNEERQILVNLELEKSRKIFSEVEVYPARDKKG